MLQQQSVLMKSAVQPAVQEEHCHHLKEMAAVAKKVKDQEETLLTRTLTAEQESRESAREASTSSQRADDIGVVINNYKEQIETLQSQNTTFNSAIAEL